jgi:ATP-binding cassette, subfamily B, bacterial PglK
MRLAAELWGMLTPRHRRAVLTMQLVSLVMAFSTVSGIASITPFFAVLGEPQLIERSAVLHRLYLQGGFSGTRSFTLALGIGFAAVVLIANLINFLGLLAFNRLALRIGNELQTTLFGEYLAWPYAAHASTNSTALLNNVVFETTRATLGVLQQLFTLVTSAATAALIIVSILLLKPWLALLTCAALAGGYGLIYLVVRNRLLRIGEAQSRFARETTQVVTESFGAIKEVIVLQAQGFFRDNFQRASQAFLRAAAQSQIVGQTPRYIMECVAAAGIVGVALVLLGRDGGVGPRLGSLTFLAFAVYRLLPTLQQVFASIVRIRADRPALDGIVADLRRARATQRASARTPRTRSRADWSDRPAREIRLTDVSYRYAPDRPWALREVSLRIQARTTVGIVGANGSGKSTLVDLIAGLLTPAAGLLEVDGCALDEANVSAWQARLGYVPQNIFLLDSSIAQNIALGIAPADVDGRRLVQAARLAQLEDFVTGLPHGYEQRIGERGVALSGGQRQRIGIARALYRNAPVLLFDEATNALDGLTEHELVSALSRLHGRYTILLIAHRMSTVRACDVIFHLDAGRIMGSGTYDGLLASSEGFRRMTGVR